MGIGFVGLVWLIVLFFLSALTATVLVAVARAKTPPEAVALRRRRVRAALLGPFALSAYAVAALALYALGFSMIRGSDPGIGDSISCPLPNGYELWAIDVLRRANIGKPDEEALLADITEIATDGPYVFGLAGKDTFILDTRSGKVDYLAAAENLGARLRTLGVRQSQLRSVESFYLRRRWGYRDSAALLALATVPIVVLGYIWRRYLRNSDPF
jgi:hypothetical protein